MGVTSDGVQHGGRRGQCDADHCWSQVDDAIGRPQMKGDGTDRQQRPSDAGEFECSDDPPLDRRHPEVVADRKGFGDTEEFDARRESEQRCEQQRHDYGGGVHQRRLRLPRAPSAENDPFVSDDAAQ